MGEECIRFVKQRSGGFDGHFAFVQLICRELEVFPARPFRCGAQQLDDLVAVALFEIGRQDLPELLVRGQRTPPCLSELVLSGLQSLLCLGIPPGSVFHVLFGFFSQLARNFELIHQLIEFVSIGGLRSIQKRSQLVEDRAHQTCPEVRLRVVPCVETDLAHVLPIERGVSFRIAKVLDRVVEAVHEERLARAPVAEEADGKRRNEALRSHDARERVHMGLQD